VTRLLSLAFFLFVAASLSAESQKPANPQVRRAAEYYAAMYARHYRVPVPWCARLSSESRTGSPVQSLRRARRG
jgi:hypothetical protein